MSKLFLCATGNYGPAHLQSNACTPKFKKSQSHASRQTCMLLIIVSCEPLLTNCLLNFASLKLLEAATPLLPPKSPLMPPGNAMPAMGAKQFSLTSDAV